MSDKEKRFLHEMADDLVRRAEMLRMLAGPLPSNVIPINVRREPLSGGPLVLNFPQFPRSA
jgi:hypothetical protein